MAGKVQIPQASIFTSDPLEQIFAKGVSDRDMSGLNYMFLNAFGNRRSNDQDAYMQGVQMANQLALREAQNEQQTKLAVEGLKSATELAGKGYDVAEMPTMGNIFKDPRTQSIVAQLYRDKMAADAAQSRAAAAASGQAGEPEVRVEILPGGTSATVVKGKNESLVNQAANRQRAILDELRGKGKTATDAEANAHKYGRVN